MNEELKGVSKISSIRQDDLRILVSNKVSVFYLESKEEVNNKKMKQNRIEIFRNAKFIICSECNTMRSGMDFYVMFKMGKAFDKLFNDEIDKDFHFTSCDDCCGNKFAERINSYLKENQY